MAIVVRALTGFAGEAAELRVRLTSVGQDLSRLREHLLELRQAVESARNVALPLKQENARLQSYYDRLCLIESKALKAARPQGEEKQEEEEEIRIHRPGIPGL